MNQIFSTQLLKFIGHKFALLLGVAAGITIVLLFLTVNNIQKTLDTQKTLKEKKVELESFQKSIFVSANLVQEIGDNVGKLQSFLPDKFDLLKTIETVENIGRTTQFNIQSYSLDFQEAEPGVEQKKVLSLEGSGTFEQFINFLRQYKYITGQIIAINSVQLVGEDSVITNLSVELFSYDPPISTQDLPPLEELDDIDRALLNIVKQHVQEQELQEVIDDYLNKENPFQ